ncbi:hypothetical protein EV702DRAFT_1068141 [Suillus placidus]|uniref:Uncharacterized protein n=1 Tax=Suillus placidus TaxID=48579 RepID=A0A9P7A3U5_9AGAM|nr:hypothetical protein EV702DRAFT_1068141 [Suillus placidus]
MCLCLKSLFVSRLLSSSHQIPLNILYVDCKMCPFGQEVVYSIFAGSVRIQTTRLKSTACAIWSKAYSIRFVTRSRSWTEPPSELTEPNRGSTLRASDHDYQISASAKWLLFLRNVMTVALYFMRLEIFKLLTCKQNKFGSSAVQI